MPHSSRAYTQSSTCAQKLRNGSAAALLSSASYKVFIVKNNIANEEKGQNQSNQTVFLIPSSFESVQQFAASPENLRVSN